MEKKSMKHEKKSLVPDQVTASASAASPEATSPEAASSTKASSATTGSTVSNVSTSSRLDKRKTRPILRYVTLFLATLIVGFVLYFGIKVANIYRNRVDIVDEPSTIASTAIETTALATTTALTVPVPTTAPTTTSDAAADPDSTLPEETEDDRIDVGSALAVPIYKKTPIDPNILNILVLGSDQRANEVGERSDSMILVSYDKTDHSIKLTSLMRDTWVHIPGHGWNRLNAAFAYGGVGLTINTINELFKLDIQNYVIINFQQFIKEVDKIGGVSVNLTASEIQYINSKLTKNKLPVIAGLTRLNGRQALQHVRNRHVGQGDFDRTRRQRETFMAILEKVKSTKNPTTILSFIDYSLNNVQTNIKLQTMIDISLQVLESGDSKISTARIPFDRTWNYSTEEGRSVIAIDLPDNQTLLRKFLYP